MDGHTRDQAADGDLLFVSATPDIDWFARLGARAREIGTTSALPVLVALLEAGIDRHRTSAGADQAPRRPRPRGRRRSRASVGANPFEPLVVGS